jgi:hypothetical protein
VPAGQHRLEARLREDGTADGFNFQSSRTVTLEPGENFVIDFRAAEGGFVFGLPGRADATEDPR